MDHCMFYGVPKTAKEETRVYIISCDEDFDFRVAEQCGEYESIKIKAEELGTVYTLECFEDELNNENINIDNSFVYIEQPPMLNSAPKLLKALATMLGISEADCLDDKSNVWRSAMINAQQAINEAEHKG